MLDSIIHLKESKNEQNQQDKEHEKLDIPPNLMYNSSIENIHRMELQE